MKSEYTYDFHIHTCLSPCGEAEMTPYNIVAMAKILGLDIIAITDHNSCGNCGAAIEAGIEAGILVIPGMELSTAEDIHMVCLFPTLGQGEKFSQFIHESFPPVENKEEVYGEQLYMNGKDKVLGKEEILLINASSLLGYKVVSTVESFGGICYPAHIDRSSNSVLSVLGGVDPSMEFTHFELTHRDDISGMLNLHPGLKNKPVLYSSDAHRLETMAVAHYQTLPLEDCSIESVFQWFKETKRS